MIKRLYTPETIVQTEFGCKMLSWYMRFDSHAGFLSRAGTAIGLEWFYAYDQHYRDAWQADALRLDHQLESLFSEARIHGIELAQLIAKLSQGKLSIDDFSRANEQMQHKFRVRMANLQPFLSREEYTIQPEAPSHLDTENPIAPGQLFVEPYWAVNYLVLDLLGIDVTHRQQIAQIYNRGNDPALEGIALDICRRFEAMERSREKPQGAILPAQTPLGVACLFVPQKEKYTRWCRKKLAGIECLG